MEVQTVTSSGGIEAWLVEDYAEPMFALRFAFRGGISHDPAGKEGLTNFVDHMLGQGAGDLTAVEFQRQIDDLAIRVEFKCQWDAVTGSIEALSEVRNEAAQLVGLALARPRFDADVVERIRRRLLSFHGAEARSPVIVAEAQWNAVAFPDHPYARKVAGNEASVNAITADDLKTYCRRAFARDRLKVVAVGDITAEELGVLLDLLFGALPASGDLEELPKATPVTGGRLRVAEMDLPQSVVAFGMGTVAYDSPDLIPAYVLNHIVGGNGIYSRLAAELREKRGLAYYAQTRLEPRRDAVVFRGQVATRNDKVAQTLEIIREELQKLADGHLSQAELDDAKGYLIGSYPLAFGSHGKIAAQLLDHALYGFASNYFNERKALLAAVTLDDLKRVAKYMLDPEDLIVSIAGVPALQPART